MTLEEALAALKAAQSKIDSLEAELKKHADAKNGAEVAALKTQVEQATAARDAAQSTVKRLEDAKSAKDKTDADVVAKLAIVDGARVLHGKTAKTDAIDVKADNREIMIAALKARDAGFTADGKSDDYVRARFDLAVEEQKKADASNANMNATSAAGGAGAVVLARDAQDELDRLFKSYDEAPDRIMQRGRDAWRGDTKTRADGIVMQPRRPLVYQDRFDARDVFARIDAGLRQIMPGYGRRDADPSTMFFPRQLMYLMTVPYDILYPEIKYQDIFPVSNEVPTGATTYSFHMYDELGLADIVDNYADEAPNAERKAIELIGRVFPVRSSWSVSVQDIRSGAFANVPIESLKSVTARRIIERKCDALACVGDPRGSSYVAGKSIFGAANDPNVPFYTLATKAAGGTKWGSFSGGTLTYNATPEEILRDVGGMRTSILTTTKGAIEPDTLILGTQNTSVIDTLRLDQFNETTVGAYLRTKLPWLKNVLFWPRLDTASDGTHGGSASNERIILCKRDPNIFRFVVPQEFEQFPPEPRNLSFVTQCHKRWAEPQMVQPKGFIYADGTM